MFHECMLEACSVYLDTFHSFQGVCEHLGTHIKSTDHNVSLAIFLRDFADEKGPLSVV